MIARRRLLAAAFLTPALVFVVGLIAYPLLYEVYLAFSDAQAGTDGNFIGLANFRFLVGNAYFEQALANTIFYTASTTALKAGLGLALALALTARFRGRRLVQALLVLPFLFPIPIATVAWYYIFSNVYGGLNYLLIASHLVTHQINFRGQYPLPMAIVVAVNVWHGTALFALLLLAALRTVPADILEAAATDGARRWQRFSAIQLPLLVPALVLATMLSVVGTFGDFAIVHLLTDGGPLGQTELVSTMAYQIALRDADLGLGAAVALSLLPLYAVVVAVLVRRVERR